MQEWYMFPISPRSPPRKNACFLLLTFKTFPVSNFGIEGPQKASSSDSTSYQVNPGCSSVNSHEFSELVNRPYEHIDLTVMCGSTFILHSIPLLVVTDGERGSYRYYGNEVYYMTTLPVHQDT